MKIARIAVYQADLPFPHGPYYLSGGRAFHSLDATVVKIETDEGVTGWGESTPFGLGYLPAHGKGVRAGIAEMAPFLLGQDPTRVERVNEVMDGVFPGILSAKSAIDVACWDIWGKALGLPVSALLGGAHEKPLPLISSVSSGTPEEMAAKVRFFRDQGYVAHSFKIGGSSPELDRARIAAIMAERQPGEEFLADANRGMSLDTALRVANAFPDADFAWEQPCDSYRECLSFRRRTSAPLSLDECLDSPAMLLQAIADDAIDVANIKIGKVGGLTRARRMRDICAAAGIGVSVQETGGSDIAFAALCHLAQTTPEKVLRHIWDCRELCGLKTAEGAPGPERGHVLAGGGPGLGIEVVEEALGAPEALYG